MTIAHILTDAPAPFAQLDRNYPDGLANAAAAGYVEIRDTNHQVISHRKAIDIPGATVHLTDAGRDYAKGIR